MRKLKIVFICLIVSIISLLVGLFLSKSFYFDVIKQQAVANNLQNLAFSQLVLERIDNEQFEQARSEVVRQFNVIAYSIKPEEVSPKVYTETCLVYQAIYKHRLENLKKYKPTNPLDGKINNVLKYWSGVDC